MNSRSWTTELDAIWEIPLSILSFVFSRALRALLETLGRYYGPSNNPQDLEWKRVSAEFVASPVKLLWVMARARWNLHAMISIAGAFEVQESISVDLQSLHQSAPSWTIVVYHLPSYKTLTSISSLTVKQSEGWASIPLKPGRYLLGLRYYHWAETVWMPAVKVDQTQVLEAKTVPAPADINGFYRTLIKRKTFVHVCLNYYVFNLLRYRRWLPAAFVKNVFLPVPNPETEFYYGALRPGESLHIELDSALTSTHDLYFSHYSRECFALDWYPITTAEHLTIPVEVKSVYIIRVHPKQPENQVFQREWVSLKVA